MSTDDADQGDVLDSWEELEDTSVINVQVQLFITKMKL